MAVNNKYSSVLGVQISAFLEEKRVVCGYDYTGAESILKRLDAYWAEHHYQETYLTMENLASWIVFQGKEGAAGLKNRLCVVREFSKYLCGLGILSYIPPITVSYVAPERRVLLQEEIVELFYQIDNRKVTMAASFADRMNKEYLILLRMIYLCGLRMNEACSMPLNQVDLDAGTLTILDGKGHKDRLVYMAEDLTELCRIYVEYLMCELGGLPQWLFPGKDPKKPINRKTVDVIFNDCWNKTSFATTVRKPVVHDLRHTMVSKRISLWVSEGLDFEVMRPYLSQYLGHKSFSETLYYYHMTDASRKNIQNLDKTGPRVIPEVKDI